METELEIKVRDYKLVPVCGGYEKDKISGRLYVYFNRNVYLSIDAYEKYKYLFNVPIGAALSYAQIEVFKQRVSDFIQICLNDHTATFEMPDCQHFKVSSEPNFDAY